MALSRAGWTGGWGELLVGGSIVKTSEARRDEC